MRLIPLSLISLVLAFHVTLAGEVNGTAFDRSTGAALTGVKVTLLDVKRVAIGTQNTNNKGIFDFRSVPGGEVDVEATFPNYVFPTERVPVGAATTASVDLPGMQDVVAAAEATDTARVLVADARQFDDPETGLTAAWFNFSRYNMRPEGKVLVAQALREQAREASAVPEIASFAAVDYKYAGSVFVGFTDFIYGKGPDVASADLPMPVAVAIAHQVQSSPRVTDSQAKKFFERFGSRWGEEASEAARRYRAEQATITAVRYSDWRSVYDGSGGKEITADLSLRGAKGSYQVVGSKSVGQLSHVRYFPKDGQVLACGKWKMGMQAGWFEFEFEPDAERPPTGFSGEFGKGERIGAGEKLGDWSGERQGQ